MFTSTKSLPQGATIILAFCCGVATHAYEFAGGTGEPNDPYGIATAEQLTSIGSDPNLLDKHYILLNDLDLDPNLPGGRTFTQALIAPNTGVPVSRYLRTGNTYGFTGRFDGQGHAIRHLAIQAASGDFLGLFGRIGRDAWVHNLRLEDVSITASGRLRWGGSLAGYIEYCQITNCYATGRICGGPHTQSLGGLVGFVLVGWISQSSALCDISGGDGSESLGGIAGDNGGTITNCCAAGSVSGANGCKRLGGLVGLNGPTIHLDHGTVRTHGMIIQCYASPNVSGGPASSFLGGLMGETDDSKTVGSFWDVQASGQSASAGGVGLTVAEMRDPNTYITAGWDLVGERANGTAGLWLVPGPEGHPTLTVLSDTLRPHALDGSGTADAPYRIATAEDLGAICHYNWSACYQLTADIDLSGITWTAAPILPFAGRFDGAGFTISNLTIQGRMFLGLFGMLDARAEIRNVRIADANIVGEELVHEYGAYVGCVAGVNEGNIADCHIAGTVTGDYCVGGLVGCNSPEGKVIHCSAAGISKGHGLTQLVGGLVGWNQGVAVNSYALCDVTSVYHFMDYLGGLAGWNGGSIRGCYASGEVNGEIILGGLVAANSGTISDSYATVDVRSREWTPHLVCLVGDNDGTIVKCYAVGTVFNECIENSYRGGLIGSLYLWPSEDRVVNCFWDADVSAIHVSEGGMGLTTPQMMDPKTYSLNSWGGDPTWVLDAGRDYPRLAWEGTPGEPIPTPAIDWFEGRGTPDDPYIVASAEQLARIGTASVLWDKTFLLVSDVDLAAIDFPRIGIWRGTDFSGTFDGGGHVISNLTIDTGDVPEASHIGLFGYVAPEGYVHDLAIRDAVITCGWQAESVGILVGTNEGLLRACTTSGSISGGDSSKYFGGLAGLNMGSVVDCDSTATASAGDRSIRIGGLVGWNLGSITYSSDRPAEDEGGATYQ